MENNKSVDTDTVESITIGKNGVPNLVENTEDMTKFGSPNEKENLRCVESIQNNKVDLGAKSQIDLEMKVNKDKQKRVGGPGLITYCILNLDLSAVYEI